MKTESESHVNHSQFVIPNTTNVNMSAESGAHSQRILAIVVIFFSSYIVGIYSAARASSQLLQLQQQQQKNHSLLNETHLDALDEAEAGLAVNGSELALARNGTRNPRCKYLWNELKCEQVKVSLTALRLLLLRQSVCFVVFVVGLCMYVGHTSIITQCAGSVRDSLVLGTLWHRTRPYIPSTVVV